MKTSQVIALVTVSSLVTFVLSVLVSINMVTITPKNLAKTVEEDPALFMETLQASAKKAQETIKKREIENQMKNPADIATEGRVTFGDKDAPVTIVEYSDFQCGYCAKASSNLKDIIKQHDGKVKVVYKHFPLSFHPFAKPAAEYFEAIAATDQEKAKEFHDLIFEEFQLYARLKTEDEINKAIDSLITKVGLDKSEVEKNLEAGKKLVAADLKEANKLNVGGTPTFFVNGVNARDIGLGTLIEKFVPKEN